MIPFLDLRSVVGRQRDDLLEDFRRVLDSGWFINGHEQKAFEAEYAEYCGVRHAVGVGNGLEAIRLILRAQLELGRLQPDDEVLVPANTFIATALAVTECNLVLKLVEPDEHTFNISKASVEAALSEKTRVILAVHLYGEMADMAALRALADHRGLLLIEDAAQAHGASVSGRKAGSWGHAAAFSLFPSKPLGALGDAGIITTDDDALAECIRALRNYGARVKYHHDMKGVNSRLDEVQAAFLRTKLKSLDSDNQERHRIAERYCQGINNPYVKTPSLPQFGDVHSWHIFSVCSDHRDMLQEFLRKKGVETLIHYPVSIGEQPAYHDAGLNKCPVAESLSRRVLSLPIYPGLSGGHIQTIIDACNDFSPDIRSGDEH
ncbi:MAG: DegT/DnrJ/EryC1/StrS family aminotransferase [Corticimicrobacter sp.]|uniref:DegT/DnrJ/EryC1/StrS family aminotransferase n=1 Tax=Corticimicrobacter sp. TaxID=2678536 RepID=UPI0032DB7DC9